MPLADAVRNVRAFRDDWRPAGEHDAALFRILAGRDPEQIATGRAFAREAFPRPVGRVDHGPYLGYRGVVSDDGRRVAVIVSVGEFGRGRPWWIAEFDVVAGRQIGKHGDQPAHSAHLAYLGDTLMAAGQGGHLKQGSGDLAPFPGQDLATDWPQATWFIPVASPAGGYVLETGQFITLDDVTLHAGDGSAAATLDIVPMLGRSPWFPVRQGYQYATEPGGLMAAGGPNGLAVYDVGTPAQPRLLGSSRANVMCLCSCAPGRLVTTDMKGRRMSLWQIGESGLAELRSVAATPPPGPVPETGWHYHSPVAAGRDMIVVLCQGDGDYNPWRACRVFDARTLDELPIPPWLSSDPPQLLVNSPSGTSWALFAEDSVTVYRNPHRAYEIADRLPAQWTPADIAPVTGALADPTLPPQVRALIELLRECLTWRFGDDIRIGSVGAAPAADGLSGDDIALSPGPEESR